MLRLLWFPPLLAAAACSSTPRDVAAAQADVCIRLVDAEPQEWPQLLPAVLEEGPSATDHLIAALDRIPDAPGAQAALAALGGLGNATAGPFLESWLRDGRPHSPDAALSLGRLPHPPAVPLLRSLAADPRGGPTLRAACAAALVELGHGADVLDLVRAVLLAGTPEGEELGRELGLPRRTRWALERHMIILSVRHHIGEDLGLDIDSPWPQLRESVAALTRALEEER